tara:strand:+ start:74 stop:763 length:690 start_codon:yes stop_codon:yes gene_type:complete
MLDDSSWELEFFDAAKNWRKYQFKNILKYINSSVLEIGPGTGHNVQYYKNRASQITLLETNKNLANSLKSKFDEDKKIIVLNTDIHIQEKTFDTIMYMDVLEHIEDDKKEVNKALKHLNSGGNLIFFVPAYQFLYSDFDKSIGHIKRYNKQFFLSFKENENISIVELKYFDSIGFFFAVLNKLFNKNKKESIGLGVKIWDKLMFLSRIMDLIFLHKFGKSLFCIMKKNS